MGRMRERHFIVRAAFLLLALFAADALAQAKWDLEKLAQPPRTYDAPGFAEPGVRAIFFDGPAWQGKPTRVFAWYGLPKLEPGQKSPAMVLVHGGGGTAFAEWVRLWTSRGYVAIAMDTCGCTPGGKSGQRPRHELGGPGGWGGFDQIDQPAEDQWTHHAISSVILAHSLIRAMPEVDAERTGITGISWGGYLTCIAASVDGRFKLAVPVYGCGFLGENSTWLGTFAKMGPEKAEKWLKLWDPSVHLKNAKMPMLWVTGTNDFAYPMDSLRKSYHLPSGPRTLAIRVRMPHGHGGAGENPAEIHAFADAILKQGKPMVRITEQGERGNLAFVKFSAEIPVARAELNFTRDTGKWQDRKWETIAAEVKDGEASAQIPAGASVFYLNLIDGRGLVVSSEHVEKP